ncbi:hypothetical protein R3P38DRAFT_3222981 [Favolaschia claudopus]|uniref:Uncharacterized protein n=1 Tax=Favolaschia claudopus TaxID=2862362 RepID=A0AAV9ZXM7_9AGAR
MNHISRLELHLRTIRLNADNTSAPLITFPPSATVNSARTPVSSSTCPPPCPDASATSSDGDECACGSASSFCTCANQPAPTDWLSRRRRQRSLIRADANYPFSTPTTSCRFRHLFYLRYPLPRRFDYDRTPHYALLHFPSRGLSTPSTKVRRSPFPVGVCADELLLRNSLTLCLDHTACAAHLHHLPPSTLGPRPARLHVSSYTPSTSLSPRNTIRWHNRAPHNCILGYHFIPCRPDFYFAFRTSFCSLYINQQ